jgi:hypothetical protein
MGTRDKAEGALLRHQSGAGPNVRLPIPIAAFRARGGFSQLSASSDYMRCSKKRAHSITSSVR